MQVSLRKNELVLALEAYTLNLEIYGKPGPQTCCLVRLKSPSGPSSMVPLGTEEIADCVMKGGFVFPCSPSEVFPVNTAYMSVVVNQEGESLVREFWTLHDQVKTPIHRFSVNDNDVQLSGLRLELAKYLASATATAAESLGGSDGRIFVAISKSFPHHQLQFTDAPPTDPQYMEITEYRQAAVTSDLKFKTKLTCRTPTTGTLPEGARHHCDGQ
jgi:hypothetical protein